MIDKAYLLPLLPILGFLVLALFGRKIGEPAAGWLATATVGASFVLTCVLFADVLGRSAGSSREILDNLWTWIPVGGLQVHANLLVDPLKSRHPAMGLLK